MKHTTLKSWVMSSCFSKYFIKLRNPRPPHYYTDWQPFSSFRNCYWLQYLPVRYYGMLDGSRAHSESEDSFKKALKDSE